MTAHAIDTDLTRGQERVLAAITAHWATEGIPPTIRELETATGYRSTSAVHRVVRQLEQRGLISSTPGLTRSIKLVAPV